MQCLAAAQRNILRAAERAVGLVPRFIMWVLGRGWEHLVVAPWRIKGGLWTICFYVQAIVAIIVSWILLGTSRHAWLLIALWLGSGLLLGWLRKRPKKAVRPLPYRRRR